MSQSPKNATVDDSLVLYAELTPAQVRAAQRRLQSGELKRIASGVLTSRPVDEWPELVMRHRNRVLAALFPGAVIGYRSAFKGGVPVDGVMHLSYSYDRVLELPALKVVLVKAHGKATGDQPISGRDFFFPSMPRLLMENLTISRGSTPKAAGRDAVEARLIDTCESRGEESLTTLREHARAVAPELGLEREFAILDALIGSILGTWYDAARLALFEKLAAALRETPLAQPAAVVRSERARAHFAFLESYFSNFIEGTEFDVAQARGFVLEGKPIGQRPKDSHDILGVFRQALDPGWANQTLATGEAVLNQLRERHADQMRARPEVGPGEFKDRENFAGNTAFVLPKHVRGTLAEGSKLLPGVPAGTARALLAMFLVSEVHPFNDGNGRLARLVMNAELSVVKSCRIIVPTLFREEYLDCLRVLTRNGDPAPFIAAMLKVHQWTAAFDYEDLDRVIDEMRTCNAFEKSRVQFKLLSPPAKA